MSQGQQRSPNQRTSKSESLAPSNDSPEAGPNSWSGIKDPNERRKIQNKLAQRRFRDKVKEQKEETERDVENQRQAGSAYASPVPEKMDARQVLSGLPWGGISMRHIVETGKSREQSSQRSSRESSTHDGASCTG